MWWYLLLLLTVDIQFIDIKIGQSRVTVVLYCRGDKMEKPIQGYKDYTVDEEGNVYSYKWNRKHIIKP